MFAQRVKSIAHNLEYDAKDYDVKFPLRYAKELNDLVNNFLNKSK